MTACAAARRAILLCALVLFGGTRRDEQGTIERGRDPYAPVAHLLSREAFDRLGPVHQAMLLRRAARPETALPLACCFEPCDEPDWESMQAIDNALAGMISSFQVYSRW